MFPQIFYKANWGVVICYPYYKKKTPNFQFSRGFFQSSKMRFNLPSVIWCVQATLKHSLQKNNFY